MKSQILEGRNFLAPKPAENIPMSTFIIVKCLKRRKTLRKKNKKKKKNPLPTEDSTAINKTVCGFHRGAT